MFLFSQSFLLIFRSLFLVLATLPNRPEVVAAINHHDKALHLEMEHHVLILVNHLHNEIFIAHVQTTVVEHQLVVDFHKYNSKHGVDSSNNNNSSNNSSSDNHLVKIVVEATYLSHSKL